MEQKTVAYLVRKMPEQMHKELKIDAAVKSTTMQALILEVIGEYLARQK